jgi:hypothetical protein
MRLWLKDSERKPDPTPVVTDDRVAILVGIALWLLAIAALQLIEPLRAASEGWWIWAGVAGVVLGLLGLANAHVRVRKAKRTQ